MPLPFIIYGDGPRLPSGLARIARDITARLLPEALDLRVAQVGVDWPGGWHWGGWDFCGFQPTEKDQGREAVASVVSQLTEETGERPIVLMFTDPSRCYDLTRRDEYGEVIEADFWGYFPVDAHNQQQRFGGPAREAVRRCTRVLAYGRYGAGVLKRTRGTDAPLSYLPHGIDTATFRPHVGLDEADRDFATWAREVPEGALRVGCVATNQARKDFGLLFSALAHLKAHGTPIAAWLHTDKLTNSWDVGELVTTCGLRRAEVAVSIGEVTDTQLAARYGWSDVTLAPGLGEGFGYPIVESLACGTPVVHGNYAGGVELIPEPAWLVEPHAWRLEGMYALLRPVFHPPTVAEALAATAHTRVGAAYCSGAVSYLDWRVLWPRWQRWITQGVQDVRRTRAIERAREQQEGVTDGTGPAQQPRQPDPGGIEPDGELRPART